MDGRKQFICQRHASAACTPGHTTDNIVKETGYVSGPVWSFVKNTVTEF